LQKGPGAFPDMQLCVYIANHLLSDLLRCVLTNLFFWDTGLTFPRAWQWPSFRKECVACVCLVLERLGELIARVWVLKVCSGRAGSYCFRGVRQRGGQRSRFTCLRRWWEVACHACLRLRGSVKVIVLCAVIAQRSAFSLTWCRKGPLVRNGPCSDLCSRLTKPPARRVSLFRGRQIRDPQLAGILLALSVQRPTL
jgi:hypothetical protein